MYENKQKLIQFIYPLILKGGIKMGLNLTKAIVVHHIDADGYCSGYWAVRTALNMGIQEDSIVCVSYNYDEYDRKPQNFKVFDTVDEDTVVFVVDIMLPEALMAKFFDISGKLIWIDHHGTSITKMHDYDPELANAIPGIRIDGIAASELAWAYYSGLTTQDIISSSDYKSGHICIPIDDKWIPKGTLLVSDNDTWTHQYSESKIYAALMRRITKGRPYLNKYFFDDFFDDGVIDWELAKAEEIYRFEVKKMQMLAEEAVPATLLVPHSDSAGDCYKCLIICSDEAKTFNSQMFEFCKAGLASKADIYVKAFVDEDGIRHYTLYQGGSERAKEIHCGMICKEFGGGGHPGAAGFTSKEPAFCVDIPGMEDI